MTNDKGSNPQSNDIIELHQVSKIFDDRPVVERVTFNVTPGQVFGLIGPSGSGKTTLVRMMIGVSRPSSGQMLVFGVAPTRFSIATREKFGYMPQSFFLFPKLTAWGNLSYVAGLYGIGWFKRRKLIREVLQELDLWQARGKLASDLSGGMLRRLELAAVLVHDPELAFIDEPLEGLDPILRQQVWRILEGMRDGGKTVLMTTHNMGDAERCDRLALMSEGHLLATGTAAELRRLAFDGDIVHLLVEKIDGRVFGALEKLPGVKQINILGSNDIRLTSDNGDETLRHAVEALQKVGIEPQAAESYQAPFEEVFARLVRRD